MNKCTKQRKFLFWKWEEIVHDFKATTPRKNDCMVEQICSICGYKSEMITLHDFSYNSSKKVGAVRKCKRCGKEQILYEVEEYDGEENEIWVNYVNI